MALWMGYIASLALPPISRDFGKTLEHFLFYSYLTQQIKLISKTATMMTMVIGNMVEYPCYSPPKGHFIICGVPEPRLLPSSVRQ